MQMQNEMDRKQSNVLRRDSQTVKSKCNRKKYAFNRDYWREIAIAAVAVKNTGLVC